jgi:hypothetical protein
LNARAIKTWQCFWISDFNNNISEGKIMRKLITMLVAAVFATASMTTVAAEGAKGDAPNASAKKSDKAKKPAKSKKPGKKPAKK